jgi:predicted transcriptional regulator
MRDAYNSLVSSFMTKAVISLGKEAKIRRAAKVLAEKKISGIMVTGSSGAPIGVLSDIDIVAAMRKGKTASMIQEFMSRRLYAVPPGTSIREAARIMSDKNIHRLFVYPGEEGVREVSGGEQPLGIITSKDIVKALVSSG